MRTRTPPGCPETSGPYTPKVYLDPRQESTILRREIYQNLKNWVIQ